ncbi:nuclear valosin-containing protein-like [Oncorhynchus mykiss]|uniref:nuclear valosin-containing protein-like n=1 Tax=Oncorhynchus mykiss TaxID=8022 RepID=UPI0018776A47|nr:nuclear valosin-containing protein-like [Oncorhynchus mykiss]
MNSSPMSLYKKGNPESGTSPKREQSASDSPAQAQSTPHSCGTKVSAGGWFKNKGRGPEQDSILIDLCKEEAASPAGNEVCKLLIHMRHPEVYQQLGVVPPWEFLLHGPPGCGKTLLAQPVAGAWERINSRSLVLLVDVHRPFTHRYVPPDLNSLAVTAQVMVIGATNRPGSLDPALRRAGRFDKEICLGIPDEAARLRILKTLCRKLKHPEDFDYRQLARLTPGYVGAELMALCREAAMSAVDRVLLEMQDKNQGLVPKAEGRGESEGPQGACPLQQGPEVQEGAGDESCQALADTESQEMTDLINVPPRDEQQPLATETIFRGELCHLLSLLKSSESLSEEQMAGLCILMSDFQGSLASPQPSAKSEGFATVPDVTWKDVGALHDIREELTMALLAVANESGLNFISVKGPELLNMIC